MAPLAGRYFHGLLGLVVLFSLAGCGNRSGRMGFAGQVTYKGIDIEEGAIQIFPEDASSGDSTGAMIQKGRYSVDAAHGLPPGAYRVRISAPNFKGKRPDPTVVPGAPFVSAELLPEKYNQKTILKLIISSDSSKNTHNFQLD